ncbi:MAG TPA: hypothetical protein VHZ95_13325 [Polyangiales bacterium]|jgi:hypothetical protein|nr:hypothetical protein [Polyangiales bacterium]
MATLLELLGGPAKRSAVIDDSLRVLDAEVDSKGGLSGLAIKGAYKIVKGVSPDFIRSAVDHMLDDFLKALDPLYQEAVQRGIPPQQHLLANPSRVADALLAITDGRAARAKNQMVKKTYEKLREGAKKHVEAAVPRLAELFGRQVAS